MTKCIDKIQSNLTEDHSNDANYYDLEASDDQYSKSASFPGRQTNNDNKFTKA